MFWSAIYKRSSPEIIAFGNDSVALILTFAQIVDILYDGDPKVARERQKRE